MQLEQSVADAGHVIRPGDEAGSGLAHELRRRTVRWDDRKDRPLGREVLEDLAGHHAATPPGRVGDQQQQRVRVALQTQRLTAWDVVDHLDAVAQTQALHELAVTRTEVSNEAHRDVLEPRLRERTQERLRVALAEERPRMGEPEAVAA